MGDNSHYAGGVDNNRHQYDGVLNKDEWYI